MSRIRTPTIGEVFDYLEEKYQSVPAFLQCPPKQCKRFLQVMTKTGQFPTNPDNLLQLTKGSERGIGNPDLNRRCWICFYRAYQEVYHNINKMWPAPDVVDDFGKGEPPIIALKPLEHAPVSPYPSSAPFPQQPPPPRKQYVPPQEPFPPHPEPFRWPPRYETEDETEFTYEEPKYTRTTPKYEEPKRPYARPPPSRKEPSQPFEAPRYPASKPPPKRKQAFSTSPPPPEKMLINVLLVCASADRLDNLTGANLVLTELINIGLLDKNIVGSRYTVLNPDPYNPAAENWSSSDDYVEGYFGQLMTEEVTRDLVKKAGNTGLFDIIMFQGCMIGAPFGPVGANPFYNVGRAFIQIDGLLRDGGYIVFPSRINPTRRPTYAGEGQLLRPLLAERYKSIINGSFSGDNQTLYYEVYQR